MKHPIRSRLLRAVLLFVLMLGGSASSTPVTAQSAESPYYDLAVDDTRGQLYASNQFEGTLDVIAMSTLEVIDRVIVGSRPFGMDMSPDGNQLAVALQDQGEVALVNLDTLAITQRLVPNVKIGPNRPVEVEYGRPGRLYTVGNPGSQGIDYLHVFDTNTNLEIARSGEVIRYQPYLAITADGNRIYTGETTSFPQQLFRFDISGDQPVLDAQASESPIITGSLCVSSQGQVVTSGKQIWSGDLSQNLTMPPYSYGPFGFYVECDPVKLRAYFTGFDATVGGSGISIFDTSTSTILLSFTRNGYTGPGRLSAAGDILYVATDSGIEALEVGRLSVVYLPQIGYRDCPGFSDTFDYPASGWRVAEDEVSRSEYSNGEFQVLLKDRQVAHLYRAPTCANLSYQVEVSARWINRIGDNYGLMFDLRENDESYYLFEVNSSNSTYRLVLVYHGITHEIIPPTKHPAIRSGTQTNRLTVGVENAVVLRINDEPVRFEPINLMHGVAVGVGVSISGRSNSEVGFDDFQVTSPFYLYDYPNPYP